MKKIEIKNFQLFNLKLIVSICLISLSNNILEIPFHLYNNISYKNIFVNDEQYLEANIIIGSNYQEFNLLLDTMSSSLWVRLEGSDNETEEVNYYNPYQSNTSKNLEKQFELNESYYYCKGNYYKDEILFIDYKTLNFTFGVCNETKLDIKNIDGIMGLSYAFEDENLSLLNSLKSSGITDSLSFSLFFDDIFTQDNLTGILYIGKNENFTTNKTISCPLKFDRFEKYWAYNLKSFALNNSDNEVLIENQTQVIFSTSNNEIILPLVYYEIIANNSELFDCILEKNDDMNSSTYKLACFNESTLPNVKLKFNGQIFILPHEFMFYQFGEVYYSKIIFSLNDFGIIGTPFFFLFHTMFDKEKNMIRFYPLNEKFIERGEIEEKEDEDEEESDTSYVTDNHNENNNNDDDDILLYLLIIIPFIIVTIIVLMIFLIIYQKRVKQNQLDINNDINEKFNINYEQESTNGIMRNDWSDNENSFEKEKDLNQIETKKISFYVNNEIDKSNLKINEEQKIFVNKALEEVNKFRDKHKVSPLKADNDLIERAFIFAEHKLKDDNMKNDCLNYNRGQELGMNFLESKKQLKPEEVINNWYQEGNNYNYKEPNEQEEECEFFTQLVWKETKKFGIGYYSIIDDEQSIHSNKSSTIYRKYYYIALFYPAAGNTPQEYKNNVFEPQDKKLIENKEDNKEELDQNISKSQSKTDILNENE